MKTTKQLIEEGVISSQIAKLVMITCPYDGYPIVRNEELTVAFCARPSCIGHRKFQLDDLLKHFGVKGIGPQKCEEYLNIVGIDNIFMAAEMVLGYRPQMHLSEIAKFCYTRGISNEWENVLAGFASFTDFYNTERSLPYRKYKGMLLDAEKYVNVLKPLSREKVEVMITGSIIGYSNRELFIKDCNEIVGGVIRVKLCGAKQSADYLIVEEKEEVLRAAKSGGGSTKARAAINGGVKVVTSKEFVIELAAIVKTLIGGQ